MYKESGKCALANEYVVVQKGVAEYKFQMTAFHIGCNARY